LYSVQTIGKYSLRGILGLINTCRISAENAGGVFFPDIPEAYFRVPRKVSSSAT
jgi:hypothetical protein